MDSISLLPQGEFVARIKNASSEESISLLILTHTAIASLIAENKDLRRQLDEINRIRFTR